MAVIGHGYFVYMKQQVANKPHTERLVRSTDTGYTVVPGYTPLSYIWGEPFGALNAHSIPHKDGMAKCHRASVPNFSP